MTVHRADVVNGTSGNGYHCPNLTAIDGHLDHLRRRLTTERDQRVRPRLLADLDRLLDYRHLFTATRTDVGASR